MSAYYDPCGTCRFVVGYKCVIKESGNTKNCPCATCLENDQCQADECTRFLSFFAEHVKALAKKQQGFL